MRAWQYRYLAQVASWGDSWGVLTQVEAGKVRETAGGVEYFYMYFLVSEFVIFGFLECGEGP